MAAIARQLYLLAHNSVAFVLSPVVTIPPMEPQICKIYLAFTNSVVISIISTIFCVAVGSMAAYALARIQYRPKFGNIMIFVLLIVGVILATTYAGVPWWMSSAVALALFFFFGLTGLGGHYGLHTAFEFWIGGSVAPLHITRAIVFAACTRFGNHHALALGLHNNRFRASTRKALVHAPAAGAAR